MHHENSIDFRPDNCWCDYFLVKSWVYLVEAKNIFWMIFTVALFDSPNSSFQVGNIREINKNLKTLFAYQVKVCLRGKLCTQVFSSLLSSDRKTKLRKVVENNHNIPWEMKMNAFIINRYFLYLKSFVILRSRCIYGCLLRSNRMCITQITPCQTARARAGGMHGHTQGASRRYAG